MVLFGIIGRFDSDSLPPMFTVGCGELLGLKEFRVRL
jgi:hypothetical protein